MPITPTNPFKGRHYSAEAILLCVRWYLRYPLTYEHVAEMMAERGLGLDPSCISRWVQVYGPEINERCRPHLKPTNKSYRVDEAYVKVKSEDDICIGEWIRQDRPSISCSRPSGTQQAPNASSARL